MNLWTGLLNLIFPLKCPLCGRVQDLPGVCPTCEAAMKWTGEADELWEPIPGLVCAAPRWYEGVVRTLAGSVRGGTVLWGVRRGDLGPGEPEAPAPEGL